MLPLFSIFCAVKNRASLIRRSVESVLAQDDPAVEFVVQDGASTDGTLEILREYGDRIRLVSEPDAGPGDGQFRALRRVRGEFWGSCMSDEQLVPDAVSWARRTFAAHPDVGGIYGCAEGIDCRGTRLSRMDAGEFSLDDLLTYRQLPPFLASFFRMESYRQIGLWEYTGGGEIDLWLRFAVRFPIRRFPKLVAYYVHDRSALSNQTAMYVSERAPRLEALRRLFHDDAAGRRYQALEARAYAGYFLRFAGQFIRNANWDLAREAYGQARLHWPACAAPWLPTGSVRLACLQHQLAAPAADGRMRRDPLLSHLQRPSRESCAAGLQIPANQAEPLRLAWLQYTLEQPFNVWTMLPSIGVTRVALFGGEGWGLAIHRQLRAAGVGCVAVIENNASTRQAAMISAPYFSLAEYLERGPEVDAVLSSLQGDHDREVLLPLQQALGRSAPVLSWKTLFARLAEQPSGIQHSDSLVCQV